MKKIILGIVFVFATSLSIASISKSENKSNFEANKIVLGGNCHQDAWDYGTLKGNGDPYWEWYYTNKYFNENCRNQGLE